VRQFSHGELLQTALRMAKASNLCHVRNGSSPCKNVLGLSVVCEPGFDLDGFPDFSVLGAIGDVSGVILPL
jgi:hypothetical protein